MERADLCSLEWRKLKILYKIMRGRVGIHSEKHFPLTEMHKTRGHQFKLRGRKCREDLMKNTFTQIVGSNCNVPTKMSLFLWDGTFYEAQHVQRRTHSVNGTGSKQHT